jgi:putative flippase GtrA
MMEIMTNTGSLSATADKRSLMQLVCFALVGLGNTVTALFLVWVFHALLGLEVWVASGGAYTVATVQSYLVNREWTFAGAAKRNAGPQFFAFIAVNIVCGTLFSALNAYLEQHLDLILSTAIAIAVTFPISFILNRFFVFFDERR